MEEQQIESTTSRAEALLLEFSETLNPDLLDQIVALFSKDVDTANFLLRRSNAIGFFSKSLEQPQTSPELHHKIVEAVLRLLMVADSGEIDAMPFAQLFQNDYEGPNLGLFLQVAHKMCAENEVAQKVCLRHYVNITLFKVLSKIPPPDRRNEDFMVDLMKAIGTILYRTHKIGNLPQKVVHQYFLDLVAVLKERDGLTPKVAFHAIMAFGSHVHNQRALEPFAVHMDVVPLLLDIFEAFDGQHPEMDYACIRAIAGLFPNGNAPVKLELLSKCGERLSKFLCFCVRRSFGSPPVPLDELNMSISDIPPCPTIDAGHFEARSACLQFALLIIERLLLVSSSFHSLLSNSEMFGYVMAIHCHSLMLSAPQNRAAGSTLPAACFLAGVSGVHQDGTEAERRAHELAPLLCTHIKHLANEVQRGLALPHTLEMHVKACKLVQAYMPRDDKLQSICRFGRQPLSLSHFTGFKEEFDTVVPEEKRLMHKLLKLTVESQRKSCHDDQYSDAGALSDHTQFTRRTFGSSVATDWIEPRTVPHATTRMSERQVNDQQIRHAIKHGHKRRSFDDRLIFEEDGLVVVAKEGLTIRDWVIITVIRKNDPVDPAQYTREVAGGDENTGAGSSSEN